MEACTSSSRKPVPTTMIGGGRCFSAASITGAQSSRCDNDESGAKRHSNVAKGKAAGRHKRIAIGSQGDLKGCPSRRAPRDERVSQDEHGASVDQIIIT